MSRNLVWLAGRGVSMSCGLTWNVPPRLETAYRRGEITPAALKARICDELARAQDAPGIDVRPLGELLRQVRRRPGERHRFVTTNWDGLLDRALAEHGFDPPLHLNGSLAERNIVTEYDAAAARDALPHAREGLRALAQADVCVVAGLSLSSPLDKALIARLAGKRGGRWLVVNHDAEEVREACELLRSRLPGASVGAVREPFDAWVSAGMPGVQLAPVG